MARCCWKVLVVVACGAAVWIFLLSLGVGWTPPLVRSYQKKYLPYGFYHLDSLRNVSTIHLTLPGAANSSLLGRSDVPLFSPDLPIVYVITPTYTRHVQKAELTNMCSVLKHAPNMLWIVLEDSKEKTDLVVNYLSTCRIPAVHMAVKSTDHPELTKLQRNMALRWIRENVDIAAGNGVFYFADDDNTYDPEIFNEMRYTKGISVWPVGLAGHAAVEGPIVKDGKVVDWVSNFAAVSRKFPIDMAGFAVNVKLLSTHPQASFTPQMGPGYLETAFIESFGVSYDGLEPKADNCSKVLVWHTQTVKFPVVHVKETRNKQTVPNVWRDV